jgi:hypothetical protein
MSLNPQAQGNDLFDVLEGSVSSYFTQMGSVLQQNECVNGQYRTTSSGSYANACPAALPAFTRVCLSTNGSTIVDMDTSYVTAKIEYTLSLDKAIPAGATPNTIPTTTRYFIGFKNSIEALERYSIYVNAQELYTQLHVGPESTIFTAGLNDMIKATAPYVFTPSKNALEGNNNVCGVYVDFPAGYNAHAAFKVVIPIKINLNQILPIASMKYLPSWMGRWELEMHFHWRNLVIIPVDPAVVVAQRAVADVTILKTAILATANYNKPYAYSTQFTQIGLPFKSPDILDTVADPNALLVVDNQILTCTAGEVNDVFFSQVTFQIQSSVNDALRAKYMEEPLIIPTNILQYAKFSGQPGNNNDGTSVLATLSQCLENCDSIFLLVPNNNFQETCFYQPYLDKIRLTLGEFGVHPSRYVDTYNDPRFIAMCLDSLNLEKSDISSMNEDVARSLNQARPIYRLATDGSIGVATAEQLDLIGDKSSFFIGVSLSQLGFQSGCVTSPNTNIPFVFEGNLHRRGSTDSDATANGAPILTSLIAMFLLDCAIIVQVSPNSNIPIVKLTSKSVV